MKIYARNTIANWIGYGANILVAFFLTPFIVHTLGDTQYGTWSLLVSMVGYMGVIDVGVRASLGRFVNYYQGRDDPESANEIISTATVFFVICGILAMVIGAILALSLPVLFPKIPQHLVFESRLSLLLVAATVGANFIGVIFQTILQSRERFAWMNAIEVLCITLRAGLTVWVLREGYGLPALATAQLAIMALQAGLLGITAKWAWPVLKIRRRFASVSRFREIIGFSVWAFIGVSVFQLIQLADMIIITNVIAPAAVTFYSIGSMLRQRAGDVVRQAARVTVPELQRLCARGDFHGVRWMTLRSANMNATLFIGLLGGIGVFGDEFIRQWMGPGYESAYNVAVILLIGSLAVVTIAPVMTIAAALNRVRIRAYLSISRLVLNVGCSLALVYGFGMGVEGVALGTTISMWLLFPVDLALLLLWTHMPLRDYLKNAIRWVLMAAMYTSVCLAMKQIPTGQGWPAVLAHVALAGVAYVPLAWTLGLNPEDRQRVRSRFGRKDKRIV